MPTEGRLVVKNWNRFQHYKNRRPAWIKLATDLFNDDEFMTLPMASKLLAICIWTLASKSADGSVKDNFSFLQTWGHFDENLQEEHLEVLVDKGFLIRSRDVLADGYPHAMPRREEEEEENSRGEEEMRATKQIPISSIQILGVKAERENSSSWLEIKQLVAAYSDHDVITAFEAWAEENKGETFNGYPVSAFLKTALGRLRGIIIPKNATSNQRLKDLCTALFGLGGQLFVGPAQTAVKNLLDEYSDKEILGAYNQLVSSMDDFERKFAVKKFSEGAVAILDTRRLEAAKTAANERMMAAVIEREQAKAAVENTKPVEEIEETLSAE